MDMFGCGEKQSLGVLSMVVLQGIETVQLSKRNSEYTNCLRGLSRSVEQRQSFSLVGSDLLPATSYYYSVLDHYNQIFSLRRHNSNLESYNVLRSCIGYSQLNSDDK